MLYLGCISYTRLWHPTTGSETPMQPWCPFAIKKASPNVSAGRAAPVRAIVLHIAQGGASGSLDWLTNPKSKVSSHFFITKLGLIYQLVSLADTAWCNGLIPTPNGWLTPSRVPVTPRWAGLISGKNPNGYTVSVEHEGKSGQPLTPQMREAQERLLAWLAEAFAWSSYAPAANLIGHGDINPVDKMFCPGTAFDFGAIAQRVNTRLAPPPDTTAPGMALLTEQSTILSAPRCTIEQLQAYLLRGPIGGYTPDDIKKNILPAYWRICVAVGVDPLVAIAQLVVETTDEWQGKRGPLCSFWAQRPQRNPAGIGVDGSYTHSADEGYVKGYTFNTQRRRWEKGISFATWADDAIPAHIGRLLAYATKPGERSQEQMQLVARAMSYRLLPAELHGSAPRLKALGKAHNPTGQGWASPGTDYGAHIARVANAIRGL